MALCIPHHHREIVYLFGKAQVGYSNRSFVYGPENGLKTHSKEKGGTAK